MPRPRFSWPLLLLIAGLGCIALALAEAGRSIRANQRMADRAAMGYANFALWSYEEHLTESLRLAAQEMLGAVNMFHTSPPIPTAASLGHMVPWNTECTCHAPKFGPLPVAFAGFTLGHDTVDIAYNRAPLDVHGWLVDAPSMVMAASRPPPVPTAEQRRWINGELTRLARAPLSRWGYQVLVTHDGDSTLAFALTQMPTSWGDTVVYAVQYGAAAVDSLLAATLDRADLLPTAIATRVGNRDVLSTEVRDAGGHVLLASTVPAEWKNDASTTLPSSYGGLSIRMEIHPEFAGQMIIGGLPRSRLPLLLALLVVAAGLTAIAVTQLRRDARFARERTNHVAATSHELRTPLAQIRLVVDMLRLDREKDPARREASLALVDREVTRLQHLVDTVLRFSRRGGPVPMTRQRVDVAAETRAVVGEFEPLASPRAVRLAVEIAANPEVLLEPGAVRQVLLNLLDNAVKYGPDGQVVTVSVDSLGTHGARIAVRDNGLGVPMSERERIWQPFERGAAAAERAAGGSGIGLTVVREIAERHGGRAYVAPSEGTGAHFVVEFPGGG